MRRPTLLLCALLTVACLLFSTRSARADEDSAKAGEAFTAGLAAAKEQRWGEALASFERAAASKSHPLTTYNIGVAERALGQYTRARSHLAESIGPHQGGTLSENYAEQARTYLTEIDKLLVHVDLSVETEGASLVVDGRPLTPVTAGDYSVQYAGVAPAASEAPVRLARFEVVTDPGIHVFALSKSGYETVAMREELKPGIKARLVLSLTAMGAKLGIDSDRARSVVRVDDIDIGVSPVVIERPAGEYKVEVKKAGFAPYESKVTLRPGQRTDIFARMAAETPLTQKWWFWTGIGVLAIGAGITTYALLYDPSYDGGNRGWVAQPR